MWSGFHYEYTVLVNSRSVAMVCIKIHHTMSEKIFLTSRNVCLQKSVHESARDMQLYSKNEPAVYGLGQWENCQCLLSGSNVNNAKFCALSARYVEDVPWY